MLEYFHTFEDVVGLIKSDRNNDDVSFKRTEAKDFESTSTHIWGGREKTGWIVKYRMQ